MSDKDDYIDNEVTIFDAHFYRLYIVARYTPYTFEHRFYIPSTPVVFIFIALEYLAIILHVDKEGFSGT